MELDVYLCQFSTSPLKLALFTDFNPLVTATCFSFSVCKFVWTGQNIQTEVLVERSIFADVFHHLDSLNWKLNWSRKENMHHSIIMEQNN